MLETSRTWAEINLNNIEHNYDQLKAAAGSGTSVMGIVKSNAYGHGFFMVADLLEKLGCNYFAVATPDEAAALRELGINAPILILGYTPPEFTEQLIYYEITQAVSSFDMAVAISQEAQKLGKALKVHLKIDSGMGRTGFVCHSGRDAFDQLIKIMSLPGLDVEGIFTHFAVSEDAENDFTDKQYSDFISIVNRLEQASGKRFKIKHCCNSGGVIEHCEKYLDMVRPGIALYGLYPGSNHGRLELAPALALKTRIYQLSTMDEGDTVSYGRTYTVHGKRRIAVIPIGYGDGLYRSLSGKLEVLVNGKRAPQVGTICMDMCMIDVTDIPSVRVGDVVTIIGRDGAENISADEIAEKAGTISYEILCSISPRVPRLYIKDGMYI